MPEFEILESLQIAFVMEYACDGIFFDCNNCLSCGWNAWYDKICMLRQEFLKINN